MAFTPDGGSGSSSSPESGFATMANIGAMFGSAKQKSAAIDGAKDFRTAAKSGKFRIDPDTAKGAIKDLERAERAIRGVKMDAERLAQRPRIGGSPYANKAAGWYRQGGESAREAVIAFADVLKYTREGYEFAVRSYQRTESDNAQTFNRNL